MPDDYRQDSGCFFALSHKDNKEENEPIKYGDIIRIHSLFAISSGDGKKKYEGPLGKERIWSVNKKETPLVSNLKWHDILVANISSEQSKNGFADFKIVSPTGMVGPIHKNDIVEIVSLAPHTKNKRVWINPNSRFSPPYFEPFVIEEGGEDIYGKDTNYGQRNFAGQQFFQIQPINSELDVPSDYEEIGKNQKKITPIKAYNKIKGNFFKVESDPEKADVKQDTKDGIGVFKEIRNFTGFPLKLYSDNFKVDIPDDTYQFEPDYELTKPLTLKGFSREAEIKNFDQSKMVSLKKMWSKGVAWLTESLQTPGKTTVKFLARGQDPGGIQVFFSDKLDPSYKWRILIGGWKNTKSAIFRGKNIVTEVDGKTSPLAQVLPGRFVPYWISINNGFVMAGVGIPGENVFMSCFIPNPEKINRVGFSSHDGNVDYTEIEISNHLVFNEDGETYNIKNNSLQITKEKGKISWLDKNLRVPGEGGIYFESKTKHPITLVFENAQNENYKIIIGAKNGRTLQVLKKNKIVLDTLIEELPWTILDEKINSELWVSFERNKIFVGQGKDLKNIFAVWEDQAPIEKINKIGFISSGYDQKILGIKYIPPMIITSFKTKSKYEKVVKRFPYKGSLLLFNYLEWVFFQDGQRVAVKDMVTGKKFDSYATPQQGTRYPLRVDMKKDGNPDLILLEEPKEAPEKIELEKQAASAIIAENELKDNAEGLLRGAEAMASFSGGGGTGEYIALAAGGALVAGSTVLHSLGAAKAAKAARLRLQAEMGYRSNDSEVFTELVQREAGMFGTVPESVIKNRDKVYAILDEVKDIPSFDKESLDPLLSRYLEILFLINHPYILEDSSVRERIFYRLEEISNQIDNLKTDNLFSKAMSTFLMAFSNNLLIDKNNDLQVSQKEDCYLSMLELAEYLFEKSLAKKDFEVEIKPLYGEYLWLPEEINSSDGKVGIVFEARGNNDVFVSFAQDNFEAKDPENKIYEFVFGSWNNERIELRVRSLGRPAVEISTEETKSKGVLHKRNFNSFWISIDNDLIEVGKGKELGKNILISWKDTFPWKNIKYIGFGSWNTPVFIRNIKLYPENKEQIKELVDASTETTEVNIPEIEVVDDTETTEVNTPEIEAVDDTETVEIDTPENAEVDSEDEESDEEDGESDVEKDSEEDVEEETNELETTGYDSTETTKDVPPEEVEIL